MIYELSFRGPGGSVVPGKLSENGKPGSILREDLVLVGYEHVTFLIHGFNVDEKDGRTSLSRLARHLETAEGAYVFVLWPGDSPVGPLSYSFTEGNQAKDTAAELVRFIDSQVGEETSVNLVAHSLGCRVTLEAISMLHAMAKGDRDLYPVAQVCLLAGAVDDYCLSIPDKYKSAAERAIRVVVLSSVEDEVLKFIYPAGDLLQAFIFFWKESFGFALGYNGPKNVKSRRVGEKKSGGRIQVEQIASNVVSIKIDKSFEVGHGDYLPPGDKNDEENEQQLAAMDLTLAVLEGESELFY